MIQFTNSYESQFSSIAMVFYNGGGAILKLFKEIPNCKSYIVLSNKMLVFYFHEDLF